MAALQTAEADTTRLDVKQHLVAVQGAEGLVDEPAQPDGSARLWSVGEQDAQTWQRIGEHRAPSPSFREGKPRSGNLLVQWCAD
jgi:hypothetical protein